MSSELVCLTEFTRNFEIADKHWVSVDNHDKHFISFSQQNCVMFPFAAS